MIYSTDQATKVVTHCCSSYSDSSNNIVSSILLGARLDVFDIILIQDPSQDRHSSFLQQVFPNSPKSFDSPLG